MNCEQCGIDGGQVLITFNHFDSRYLCQDCHPSWPVNRNIGLSNLRTLGKQQVSEARINWMKQRSISKDDGKTVIQKDTGKKPSWV